MTTLSQSDTFNFSLQALRNAKEFIHEHLHPTPQISWPLLNSRCACHVQVKHENHLPTGAFKVRGGIWYLHKLCEESANIKGVVAATRGNHGQSVAYAAALNGIKATVVVPHGNSPDKNNAMRAYGAELIEYGKDFNEALDHAKELSHERELHMLPSLHPLLVQGVASYSLEFLDNSPDLETVYVPIGLGSGICGMIAARNALNSKTRIIGVVADKAPAYALSFEKKELVLTQSADTLADGLAVRIPDQDALDYILDNVERIVTVSENQILQAIRYCFTDTHNVAEGAGASTLAALLKEKEQMQGKNIGLILSGGNIDQELFMRALES